MMSNNNANKPNPERILMAETTVLVKPKLRHAQDCDYMIAGDMEWECVY